MNMPPGEWPAGLAWIVTRQEPDQVSFSLPGEPVYGVNVYFLTAIGNRGVVFVPDDRYHDLRNTHRMISAKAKIADETLALNSATFG